MKYIAFLILVLVSSLMRSQEYLNLDFEHKNLERGVPNKWFLLEDGCKITLDNNILFKGKYSLKIESLSQEKKAFGICTNSLAILHARNKLLEIRGKVKTSSVSDGSAKIWCRVNTKEESILATDILLKDGLSHNNEWTEIITKIEVPKDVKEVLFGGMLTGNGTAWFDDFEIFINGIKYNDLEPKIVIPSEEQLAWLRKNIIPLKHYDPGEKNQDDLQIFGELIGDAKIVALGENTHGSREIFQIKHRLIRYLTQNKDFNIFSIEANMPESYDINDYTISGEGNLKELIKGLHFWTWQTKEVLDMVEWMKEQNQTNKKIQFTGFDLQVYQKSIKLLANEFADNENIMHKINRLRLALESIQISGGTTGTRDLRVSEKSEINTLLSILRSAVENKIQIKSKKEWLLRNIRIIEQYVINKLSFYGRDEFMAENIEWIFNQNPDSKLTIWAHNGHIMKNDFSMGQFLSQKYNEDYVAVGFTFHTGKYTAHGSRGLNVYEAQNSYPGTFEFVFNALNEPIFLLDLRKIRNDNSVYGDWMKESLEFRSIGAGDRINEFQPTRLIDEFDILIFISEIHNSELIK